MHTEGEIRASIKPLVELYGELTTTEVKTLLPTVLEFDDEDNEPSPTRNEVKILQRIGNIVSHQKENIKFYPEGFMVDKTLSARFMAVTGLSGKEKPLSSAQLNDRKNKATKRNATRKIYKIDWNFQNERKTFIGLKGEEFVFSREKEKVKEFDPKSVDKVIHLSVKEGDGFGYDILSINEKGETVFIEVKTTTSSLNTPFYMSLNEKSFFEENIDNNAFIYRVYDFKEEASHGKIQIISASDLLNNYNFDPISFLVSPKNK